MLLEILSENLLYNLYVLARSTKDHCSLNQRAVYLRERIDWHIDAPLRNLARLQCDRSIANCQTFKMDTKSDGTVDERKSIVTNDWPQN